MHSLAFTLLCTTAVPALAMNAQLLYTSDYNGSVSTLQLNTCGKTGSLEKVDSLKSCNFASWLTYNPATRHLFCVDETVSTNGSLWSYTVDAKGKLKAEASNITTLPGPVNSELYGGNANQSTWIALADYGNASISTYALPLNASSKPLQTLSFKGSNFKPSQASAHPHQVIRDPTHSFLLSPDLGADAVHVFAINSLSGLLVACPDLNLTAGSGPRHLAFHQDLNSTQMYLANELSNVVSSFVVDYPNTGCMNFTFVKNAFPYQAGNNFTARAATPSEIRTAGNFLYVSTRNDSTWGGSATAPGNDSIATFTLKGRGDFALDNVVNAWGQGPRTFDISADGAYLAIGNQLTGNVAVIPRDVKTGALGNKTVANFQVAALPIKDGYGLSSVIFDRPQV